MIGRPSPDTPQEDSILFEFLVPSKHVNKPEESPGRACDERREGVLAEDARMFRESSPEERP